MASLEIENMFANLVLTAVSCHSFAVSSGCNKLPSAVNLED